MTADTLPIPLTLLPVPRLIVWHGDVEDPLDPSGRALATLRRAYHAAMDHGIMPAGILAGGNDWTGWHIPDAGAVAGLADVARAIGPAWWRIIHEPTAGYPEHLDA